MDNWKTRLSTLWLINVFTVVLFVLLGLFESGDLTHIVPPLAVDDLSLLLVSVGILIKLAMAFLSQSLADKLNRWLNILVGAVFSIVALVVVVMILMDDPSVLAINPAAGFVFGVLIIWTAWKSE